MPTWSFGLTECSSTGLKFPSPTSVMSSARRKPLGARRTSEFYQFFIAIEQICIPVTDSFRTNQKWQSNGIIVTRSESTNHVERPAFAPADLALGENEAPHLIFSSRGGRAKFR
jgi:hypothetical protein